MASPTTCAFSLRIFVVSSALVILSLFGSAGPSAVSLFNILPITGGKIPSGSSPFSDGALSLGASRALIFS